VIFTPKYRRPVLVDGIALTLKKLILDKQKEYGYKVFKVNVEPDHVHLILQCDPDRGISNVVAKIKCQSAIVMRRKFPELKTRIPCLWTRAKYVASIGSVDRDEIKQYIKDQKNV
jgi:putative transposase